MLDGSYDYTIALIALTGALGKTGAAPAGWLRCRRWSVQSRTGGRVRQSCGLISRRCNLQTRGSLAAERVQRVGVDAGKLAVVLLALRRSASARMGVEAA